MQNETMQNDLKPIELKWLGHGSWQIQCGETKILLDPFLNESPVAPCKAADVDADFILVSHGHFDHVADVAEIANRCDATVVAMYEIANWFQELHAVKNAIGMNIGGATNLKSGDTVVARVKMTPAIHSSQLPDGSYGGMPAGFVLEACEQRVYFACDTALFSDMRLIGEDGLDAAVLPIGDLFTMGPEDSVKATGILSPTKVIPAHYNTWPPIEQDAAAWAKLVRDQTKAEPIVIQPGESITI